jgi:hypothetical protein
VLVCGYKFTKFGESMFSFVPSVPDLMLACFGPSVPDLYDLLMVVNDKVIKDETRNTEEISLLSDKGNYAATYQYLTNGLVKVEAGLKGWGPLILELDYSNAKQFKRDIVTLYVGVQSGFSGKFELQQLRKQNKD